MKKIKFKKYAMILLGGLLTVSSSIYANPIQTPEGKMPFVHWAVVEATEGHMPQILSLGVKNVAPTAAKELGTYALYGGVDKHNSNLLRILEIYEDENAYQIHRSSNGFKLYQLERANFLSKLIILEAKPIVLEQKSTGTGSSVYMDLIVVKSDKIDEYENLIRKEMQRAVNDDEGVLGLFATAEKDNPGRIHTMGIYENQTAYERYIHSSNYKNFCESVEAMIMKQHSIENQPTAIVLSSKGLN
ncbi:antibiotic biosynthesis monooxygenase [Bacteroides sp.]|uniref:putative quinol monooxygenase n=1 Tax=Bacteroides sp. TaxID=29523 RepID=UPI0026190F92|nr:antibiotic biosynthesis monooxygenase [Bacteroides sp.]MDD3040846.1 hypothetical protein [Bacteroides sp.]